MNPQANLSDFERAPTLSDTQSEVYRLVERQGCTPTEVAKSLGVKPSTVRTHLHRARQKKRGEL